MGLFSGCKNCGHGLATHNMGGFGMAGRCSVDDGCVRYGY